MAAVSRLAVDCRRSRGKPVPYRVTSPVIAVRLTPITVITQETASVMGHAYFVQVQRSPWAAC
jgi:hypothetical protein